MQGSNPKFRILANLVTIQGVEPHLGISLYLALICSLFKTKKNDFFYFFFGKEVTSLGNIFTMEKALVQIIFGN